MSFPAHPAWDFALRVYGTPGVAPACLGLQERHGIDVTLMLFCIWHGTEHGATLGPHLADLCTTARTWREATVLPLRGARRWLKAAGPADSYRSVLAAEIDCEHAELLALARQAEAIPSTAAPPSAATVADNLAGFLAASGVAPTPEDRAALRTILAAAGAAEAAGLLP